MSVTFEPSLGLIVDNSTVPPTACNYIISFPGHGAFAPHGAVPDFTPEQIKTHNDTLGEAEMTALKKHGRGILYLSLDKPEHRFGSVGNWNSSVKIPCSYSKTSWHNFAGRNGRTDVWFDLDGSQWHGVNIGWGQICRVRRLKTRATSVAA